jgi:superfamily II DNA or RNA helicase
MSKPRVKVTLKSKDGNDLVEGGPVSLGDGYCKFPFIYKDKEYDDGVCYKGKADNYWCATKVDEKSRKLKKYAYCDFGDAKAPRTKSVKKIKRSDPFPKPKAQANVDKPRSPKVKAKVDKPSSPPKKKTVKRIVKKTAMIADAGVKDEHRNRLISVPTNFVLPFKEVAIPKEWVLPNRKNFVNWMNEAFKSYKLAVGSKLSKGDRFEFFSHQNLVRDYLQRESPFRGLLLYHGLGVGKTCASIGIAEGLKSGASPSRSRSDRKIVVILNKSLKQNFIVNLKQCGDEYYRLNQFWFYHRFTSADDSMRNYSKHVKIPVTSSSLGVWLVDFSKKPNYESLGDDDRESLEEQIDRMIANKYEFIHLDGLNKKRLQQMNEERILDNKLLIIDEVHNLSNAMAKETMGVRAYYLKKLIMEADNLKCVFLSGTPMINTLYEVGQLFNLLRGYIISYSFLLKVKSGGIDWDKLQKSLQELPFIDQVILKKRDGIVKVTRNPKGFINTPNGIAFSSTPWDDMPKQNMFDEAEFLERMKTLLSNMSPMGIKCESQVHYSIERQTAFPDNIDEFMTKFYDPKKMEFINTELFKTRIMGTVSFYRTNDTDLLPSVNVNEVVKTPMSGYQFLEYSKVRKVEIEQERSKKKNQPTKKKKGAQSSPGKGLAKKDDVFDAKSSFRAYSRMHCSFAFPESIPRPYPGDEMDVEESLDEDLDMDLLLEDPIEEELSGVEEEDAYKKAQKIRMKKYEAAKLKTLNTLDREKEDFLVADEELKLIKHSPKYNNILNLIKEKNGLAFVYTEYKTLEGIAVLSIVLRANGYAPFLLETDPSGNVVQVFENEDDIGKPMYAFWGGDPKISDIIRKVYNNQLDQIPSSLKNQFDRRKVNNLRGDIVKILLTTKTGAEGIDLQNVRSLHIVEPYWNPVRVKQVKGRAVRVGSHLQLPPADRNVDIYTHLSTLTDEQKKSDKTIAEDFGGLTSDEVLFDISQKKLQIMETLLTVIKESSVDCSLNYNHTETPGDTFKCINFSDGLPNHDYSFVPNINDQDLDVDRSRKFTQREVEFKETKFKTRSGEMKQYFIKDTPEYPKYIYDYGAVKTGAPGRPIGEINLTPEGKKKVKFYAG